MAKSKDNDQNNPSLNSDKLSDFGDLSGSTGLNDFSNLKDTLPTSSMGGAKTNGVGISNPNSKPGASGIKPKSAEGLGGAASGAVGGGGNIPGASSGKVPGVGSDGHVKALTASDREKEAQKEELVPLLLKLRWCNELDPLARCGPPSEGQDRTRT